MPTLMTTGTFGQLAKIRSALDTGPLAPRPNGRLAGIFVPWAGSRLKREGGIYYVGMVTAGPYMGDDDPPTFDAQLRLAKSLCVSNRDLAGKPFWQFLDGLSWGLLGAPFDETSDSWGWSNLLKIGWSSIDNPVRWPRPLREDQRDVCASALCEEFAKLKNSLVVVASRDEFGILAKSFPRLLPQWRTEYNDNFIGDYNEQTSVWSFTDPKSGNLYIHCDHPGYFVRARERFWGSALGRIIHLARAMPKFSHQ